MNMKKIIVSSILTAVCVLCAFTFTACGPDNSDEKDPKPVYYTVTFYFNMGLEEDSSSVSVERGKTAASRSEAIKSA